MQIFRKCSQRNVRLGKWANCESWKSTSNSIGNIKQAAISVRRKMCTRLLRSSAPWESRVEVNFEEISKSIANGARGVISYLCYLRKKNQLNSLSLDKKKSRHEIEVKCCCILVTLCSIHIVYDVISHRDSDKVAMKSHFKGISPQHLFILHTKCHIFIYSTRKINVVLATIQRLDVT